MSSPAAGEVRVITTIGHVDHGKTTFVDYLLAANNIISTRMAGKIRYMDSREDEQQRGITMESSAVSLRFQTVGKDSNDGSVSKTYVINLIDTPGHVDFSGEVSTASRLCDGTLLLVDVVEGVCTQTIAVLRQSWLDRVRPILVLNKCDRLITELKLSPTEAYQRLSQVIEQVNAVMGSFFAGERMEDDLHWREEREKRLAARKAKQEEDGEAIDLTSVDSEFQEKDDEDLYFSPERGNVIFASAIDGWGFRIGKFAQLYATKLGINEEKLRRVLWGDFYLDTKTKRVLGAKQLKGRALKPLFVQFVLDNIWAVYDSVVLNPNSEKVSKIVKTLNLSIAPRDLRTKDTRHLLGLIFGQWLSLSKSTIQAVIDVIPSPSVAQGIRLPKLLYPDLNLEKVSPKTKVEHDIYTCNADTSACAVAYVSKMFAVKTKELPENKKRLPKGERGRGSENIDESAHTEKGPEAPTPPEEENAAESGAKEEEGETTLLGFARLYSGVLQRSASLYCVLPKYNSSLEPTDPRNSKHIIKVQVEGLYVMMGRDLEPVDTLKAGNVFAIKGLEGTVWRNATLCAVNANMKPSDEPTDHKEALINLGGVTRQVSPIVRVAVEPTIPAQLPQLVKGLKLLSQADPAVEAFQQQNGEYVIMAAGELHLERCLKDLRESFAKIEIQASKPIVPFRETAIRASEMAPPKTPNAPRGTVHGQSVQSDIRFTIRAVPLPPPLLKFIHSNMILLRRLMKDRSRLNNLDRATQDGDNKDSDDSLTEGTTMYGDVISKPTVRLEEFWSALDKICETLDQEWHSLSERIWAFGPRSAGGCILIDSRGSGLDSQNSRWKSRAQIQQTEHANNSHRYMEIVENSIETGFQIATFKGPLCAEPVDGIAYFVENLQVDMPSDSSASSQSIGSLISAVQDACKAGLLDWSPRLMLAMYSCDIQASTDVLGKVYGVIAKRRGRITSEEMKEGTSFFTVSARLPVVESFGFAEDIRKRTSGAASPQLIFDGYELLDQDPFWVPSTEEELEDLGEKADRELVAKTYMDRVRERKGLHVDKKLVAFAEKQRTLKK